MPDDALRAALESLTGAPPPPDMLTQARRLLAVALDAPGGMRIGTIHAFCQSVLRRFPLEAAISPHFRLVDERDAAEALKVKAGDVVVVRMEGPAPAGPRLSWS